MTANEIIIEGIPTRFGLLDLDKALNLASELSLKHNNAITIILPPSEIAVNREILTKGIVHLSGQEKTVLTFLENGIVKVLDFLHIEGVECRRQDFLERVTFVVSGQLTCSNVLFTACKVSTEGKGTIDMKGSRVPPIPPGKEPPSGKPKVSFRTGAATDIGGGHENQDKYCCFRVGDRKQHLVMAVFDGHGRELGEVAAVTARNCIVECLSDVNKLNQLANEPQKVFDEIFHTAHMNIKKVFRQRVQHYGDWEVFESEYGYLVKRQCVQYPNGQQVYETNVHGGTTATIVVVYDNKRLFVANVGDSTAIFGGMGVNGVPVFEELSAEHSPESLEEYKRVKMVKQQDKSIVEHDRSTLWFVYDEIQNTQFGSPKHVCPPIFTIDYTTGLCKRTTNNGTYYKNVRSQWASMVTTPPSAKFQDALAFTRSLGDLHLHVYGVTHRPEVREYDIDLLHQKVSKSNEGISIPSLILVCTDGVWDNWQYNDLLKSILGKPTFLNMITDPSLSAQKLADEIMAENAEIAKRHFGNQADNMTGVVCVITNV